MAMGNRLSSILLVMLLSFWGSISSLVHSSEGASWTEGVQDFLSGELLYAAYTPTSGVLLKGLDQRTFRTYQDFVEGSIIWNLKGIDGEGVVLNLIVNYSVNSKPAICGKNILHAWQDPTNGDIYVAARYDYNGFTIIHPREGTSVTYRTTGVWNTTNGPIGVLIRDNPKISGNATLYVWKDVAMGDIYVSTHDHGLTIIHTQNTPEYADDTVDVYNESTIPAIFRKNPYPSWKDEDGNIYLGFHLGITILYTDGRSVTYTGDRGVLDTTEIDPLLGPRLIAKTPRLGTTLRVNSLFTDAEKNLYAGTDEGLVLLHYNPEMRSYDTSTTYRSTGVWDTTEDPQGVLVSHTPKIGGDVVLRIWQDVGKNIYLKIYNWGLSVLYPDGTVEDKTEKGLYVINLDGTVTVYPSSLSPAIPAGKITWGWRDSKDNFYFAAGNGINMVPSSENEVPVEGSLTSNVVDAERMQVGLISWHVQAPSTSRVSVWTRTGGSGAFWVDRFDDGIIPPGVSLSKPSAVRSMTETDGKLVVQGVASRLRLFIETGRSFPGGSIVRAKVRGIGTSGGVYSAANYGSSGKDGNATGGLEGGKWITLTYKPYVSFSRIFFEFPECDRFELDYLSVELPDGWTEWVELSDPYGSLIPDLDKGHPYLQWRALFSTEDVKTIPTLQEVSLISGYAEKGMYTSSAFDTQGMPIYDRIWWEGEMPDGTSLKFQIRTASTEKELEEVPWLGPTASEGFYTVSGARMNPFHKGDRWVQYRAFLETTDSLKTPVLREVRIEYDTPTFAEGQGEALPRKTLLAQNYPNPLNAVTIIPYQLSEPAWVNLSVYNTLGQQIRRLVDAQELAGYHITSWDARNNNGVGVRSGVYLCRLWTDKGFSETIKILLLR